MEIIIVFLYFMICTYTSFKISAIELCKDIKEIISYWKGNS